MQISGTVSGLPLIIMISHTGNVLRAFWIVIVDKHRGTPDFLSTLSNAHTLSVGSFDRSSAMVTSNDVPSGCFKCVIDPCSCALKEFVTLKDFESV